MTEWIDPSHEWSDPSETRRVHRRGSLVPLWIMAVLAASVGGFVAGRGSTGSGELVDARAGGDDRSAASESGGDRPAPSEGVDVGSTGWMASSGDWGWGWGMGPLQEVVIRTAPGPVDLRLYQGGTPSQPPADFEPYRGRPVCDYDSWAIVQLSNRGAVGIGHLQVVHQPGPAHLSGIGAFGIDEGDPAWWAAVQTTPKVAVVRSADDHLEPVEGWAVLAGAGQPPSELELLDADGVVLGTIQLDREPQWCADPGEVPPQLPEAGEQPDDPVAAEAAVRQAYGDAWNHDVPDEVKELAIEDAASLADAREQVAANFPEAVATVTVEVYDVVFTDPSSAAVRFELLYSGGAQFGEQLGYAVLRDGRWQVARETTCMALGWGGGTC